MGINGHELASFWPALFGLQLLALSPSVTRYKPLGGSATAQGVGLFCPGELDRRLKDVSFIAARRPASRDRVDLRAVADRPSVYYEHKASGHSLPDCRQRLQRDGMLVLEIRRVCEENLCVYGVRFCWRPHGDANLFRS